jgi:hypothetical protein
MKKPFYTPNRNEELAANMGFRITPDGKTITKPDGSIVGQSLSSIGYRVFSFGPKTHRYKCLVHRFNAWFKYGEEIYQPNIVCRHLDGNRLNNHINNIVPGTQSQNMMDRPAPERHAHAFATSRYAMKHDHVKIIEFYKGHGFKKTMIEFGLSSKGTLSFIINKTQTASPVPVSERPKRKSPLAPPTKADV